MSKFSNSINSSTAGARQWRALPWGQGDHCHSHLGPGKPDSIRSILLGTEFKYLLRWMVQWSNGGQNLISKLDGAVAVQNFYLDFEG